MHDVRVVVRRMGGGFGGKESQGNALAIACAVAAERTGAPCRMRYDRDDDMVITGKRHDFRIDYEVGFDEDGASGPSTSSISPVAAGRWT
jgi:xanthine dehydrogenase large subunit